MSAQNQVSGEDHPWPEGRLAHDLCNVPEQPAVQVACADGVPVSSGWICFYPASPFAILWGGSTLSAFRRRGFYTSLLAARIDEARYRDVRFLTIDARRPEPVG